MVVVAVFGLTFFGRDGFTDEPAQGGKPSLNDLSLEVGALQTLHGLGATPAQQKTLRELADKTAGEASPRLKAKASDKFRQALANLHAALVEGRDDERINNLGDQVDKLRASEKPELDDSVELTDEARL
jgi:hypothetical protein